MRPALNQTIGGRGICAWRVRTGVVWVQTRLPELARKLAQRRDSRLVVRSMAGGYLKTFAFRHGLMWARLLIERYTHPQARTGAAIGSPIAPHDALGSRPRQAVPIAGRVAQEGKSASANAALARGCDRVRQ